MPTDSLWRSSPVEWPPGLPRKRLRGRATADVAVIGAGITGLTAALLLARAGSRVAVIERGLPASGETGRTTSHATEILDARYHRIAADFGREGARLAASANRAAIARIAAFAAEESIECGLASVPGYLYAERESALRELREEAEAMRLCRIAGELTRDVPLPWPARAALRVPDQAQFNPIPYCAGLVRALLRAGGRIYAESTVRELRESDPCELRTDEGTLLAEDVIVATHSPVSNRFTMQVRIASYRTYVLARQCAAGALAPGLFWDMMDPYHYVRRDRVNGREYVIVGGEDHKTGQDGHAPGHWTALEEYCDERGVPGSTTHRWSGQVVDSVDGLPFIGQSPFSERFWLATGYAGNGTTWGTAAGMILSDQILGQANPYARLLSPRRVRLSAAREFVAENQDYPRCFIQDRFAPAEALSVDEVPPGQGRIVRLEGRKVAVFRAPDGKVTAMSPVCPHLGCHVRFNAAEASWDCPCHGSRFSAEGRVLSGPATRDLEELRVVGRGEARGEPEAA